MEDGACEKFLTLLWQFYPFGHNFVIFWNIGNINLEDKILKDFLKEMENSTDFLKFGNDRKFRFGFTNSWNLRPKQAMAVQGHNISQLWLEKQSDYKLN